MSAMSDKTLPVVVIREKLGDLALFGGNHENPGKKVFNPPLGYSTN